MKSLATTWSTCQTYHSILRPRPQCKAIEKQASDFYAGVGSLQTISTSDLLPISIDVSLFEMFGRVITTGDISGMVGYCGIANDDTGLLLIPGPLSIVHVCTVMDYLLTLAIGNFTCAAHIKPQCSRSTGTCETDSLGTIPWAVTYGQTEAKDGNAGRPQGDKPADVGQAIYSVEPCTCQVCQPRSHRLLYRLIRELELSRLRQPSCSESLLRIGLWVMHKAVAKEAGASSALGPIIHKLTTLHIEGLDRVVWE